MATPVPGAAAQRESPNLKWSAQPIPIARANVYLARMVAAAGTAVPVKRFEQGNSAPTLIVGPAWVGDMVMAQSLFRFLREQEPDRALDVVAPAWSEPLLARMPEVRHRFLFPAGHGELMLRERLRLARSLRRNGYARAIVLPRTYKSALVPFFARIPRRIGMVGEQRWGLLTDLRRFGENGPRRVFERFVSLGLPAGAALPRDVPRPALRASPPGVEAALHALRLDGNGPVLALCPGAAFGESKRWPPAHFAELARRRLDDGWRVWLLGSRQDRHATRAIHHTVPDAADLAGLTNLEQVIDLLSIADAIVSNDSGLMHIAAALGRPLVAVYGSSDPGITPPLSPRARALWLNLECSPCFQRTCPLGHTDCLWKLTPDHVDQALTDLCGAAARA